MAARWDASTTAISSSPRPPRDWKAATCCASALTGSQRKVVTHDPLLKDDVADNVCKFDATESASLLFGRDFGVGTDVQTGPNGNSDGAIYEVLPR
jgi:hypothetical protein